MVGRNNDSLIFKHLSTTQAGCCKPPEYCGFTMKNATFWEVPKSGLAANNSDCATWNNRQDKLCYECNACKGGVLANIRNQWRHLTVFNAIVLVLVTSFTLWDAMPSGTTERFAHSTSLITLCLKFVIYLVFECYTDAIPSVPLTGALGTSLEQNYFAHTQT
ncbi:unnamed protein product [Vicia faba]|uniref:Senescence-associated protein n=1 Tax=Vicia faba TaxID=3906 RepID=A0AAV1AM70_VICFA|nr:unnamed protein product [Vicia faba]